MSDIIKNTHKIIIASDSFKGTLSSSEICSIAAKVIPEYFSDCEIATVPVADGGEGTVDCFIRAAGASPVEITSVGPDWEEVRSKYAILGDTAIIEMAAAAGLPLMTEGLDPENATTYGVGVLIKDAINRGVKNILLGLGGSATTDAGCGMAAALGAKFCSCGGYEFIPAGGGLSDIKSVDISACRESVKGISITAMCDVNNPLYGKNGAAYIYSPQKGADEETVRKLDEGLRHISEIMKKSFPEIKDISEIPGAGAAGGLGAGTMWFLNGSLKSGTEAILDAVKLSESLNNADYIITGEGKVDSQSLSGKLISGVKKRADAAGVPLVIIAGCVSDDFDASSFDLDKLYITNVDDLPFEELAPRAAQDYEKALRRFLDTID